MANYELGSLPTSLHLLFANTNVWIDLLCFPVDSSIFQRVRKWALFVQSRCFDGKCLSDCCLVSFSFILPVPKMAAKAIFAFVELMVSSNCCILKMKQTYERSQRMTFCSNAENFPFVPFLLQSHKLVLFPWKGIRLKAWDVSDLKLTSREGCLDLQYQASISFDASIVITCYICQIKSNLVNALNVPR